MVAIIFEYLTNNFIFSDKVKMEGDFGDSIYLMEDKGRSGMFSFLNGLKKGDLNKRDLGPM